jgi:hypothetical protein
MAKRPEDRHSTLGAMLRELDAPGRLGDSVRFVPPAPASAPLPLASPKERPSDRAAMRERVERAVGNAFDAVGSALDHVGRAAPKVQAAVQKATERASAAVARISNAAEDRLGRLQQAWRDRPADVTPVSPPTASAPGPAPRRGPVARLLLGLARLPVLLLLLAVRVLVFPLRVVGKALAWTLRNLLFLPVRILRSVFSMTTYLVGAALAALVAIVVLELLRNT